MSDTRIGDLSEGGSWITYETKREEKLLETGVYMRIGFRSCGTVGYGPTMWVKVGSVGERSRNSKIFLRITKIYLWRDQQRVERGGECIYIPL